MRPDFLRQFIPQQKQPQQQTLDCLLFLSERWEQLSGFAWESEAAHWLGDMIGLNSGAAAAYLCFLIDAW